MMPDTAPDAIVVLVVDDELEIAEAMSWILEDAGYTVLLAGNGVKALALARDTWPALLITDLMMPRMDGIALIAALRLEAAATGRRTPPIVLMSAAASPYGPKIAVDGGVDAVLPKPFSIEELETLVTRLLEPRSA